MYDIDKILEQIKEAIGRKLDSSVDSQPEMLDMILALEGKRRHFIVIIAETDL